MKVVWCLGQDPVVVGSLECLKAAVEKTDHLYTTALLAYTFTLAGDAENRLKLIKHLDKVAIHTGTSHDSAQLSDHICQNCLKIHKE